jgi:hypothetical protein
VVGWLAHREYRVVHTVSSHEDVLVPVEYITVLPPPSFDSGDTVFARKKAATKAHKKLVAEARKKKAEARKKRQRPVLRQRRALQVIYIIKC